jgi:serine/threonine-protein phosphatase 6 regulatory ankyrin repeat subunit B
MCGRLFWLSVGVNSYRKSNMSYAFCVLLACMMVLVSTLSPVRAGPNEELVAASSAGRLEEVKLLLHKGADVNAKDDEMTALMQASVSGYLKVVGVLLASGADINTKREDGLTALMFASMKGHLPVVRKLLIKGARVNTKANDGMTALMHLMWAFERDSSFREKEYLEVIRLFLAMGADANTRYHNLRFRNRTVLMGASELGHLKLVQMLLSKGADVNAQSMVHEETALMLASENGHFKVVEALLAKEANVNAINTFGRTALDQAKKYENIRALLLKAGAKPGRLVGRD